jgi:competence ComEA-like helix-hairpin-helix protein
LEHWGVNAGRLNVRAQKPPAFSVFVPGEKARPPATHSANAFPRISETPALSNSTPAINPADAKKSHAKEKIPLGKIDINTATEKELTTVPGIGHVIAARIIAARPFRSADDLKKVSGIGDKKYAQIRSYFQ